MLLLLLFRGKVFLQSIVEIKTSTAVAPNIIIVCRMYTKNIEEQRYLGIMILNNCIIILIKNEEQHIQIII